MIVKVPVVACWTLLTNIFSEQRSEDFRKDMAFLGMASGWFGRLTVTTAYDVAFEELMQLIALAQQQSTSEAG